MGALCCSLVVGSAFVIQPWRHAPPSVSVEHGGTRQIVHLGSHPTVGEALAQAHVGLVHGHLLSAVTHTPISGQDLPPLLTLNGHAVEPDAVISGQDNHLVVTDTEDVVEAVVAKTGAAVPPPPLPRVMRQLWHPGHPGVAARAVVGVVSGEVVSGGITTAPSAPTPVTDKVVALTFDDGPWSDTLQFLQVLQQEGVTATFCMIGRQVLAHPQWVDAVVRAGMTLCNHSLSHNEHLGRAGPDVVDAELSAGANALSRVIGQQVTFYRPPGGSLSPLVEDVANRLGEQVLGWNVDPSDYRRPPAAKIVDTVMSQVRPGSIILLHDGGGDRSQTLAALPMIIDNLKAQGYTFTTPGAVSPTPLGAPAPVPAGPDNDLSLVPLGPSG